MASIRKRRGGFAVVYYYTNEHNEKKQRWEQYESYAEAHKRCAEIEYQQGRKSFVSPSKQTVSEFMKDFVSLYGERKWGHTFYERSKSLISNYINPLIGDEIIQDISPRSVDLFIQRLQKTAPVECGGRKANSKYLTPASIEKIVKLTSCAFKQAVRWELIPKNPFEGAILPKVERVERAIWTAETISKALEECTDAKLYLAMNLAFACSLRLGEILGLMWENVHITDEDIVADNAYLDVDKELTRISKNSLEALGDTGVIKIFPIVMANSTQTRLVLKVPKTESSKRRVWLPKTLAYALRDWQAAQIKQKEMLGDEYIDYNLVVAQPNGRPCEEKLINNEFKRLKQKAGLPNVVFHSLRHSSTTYKLKLNHGDIKATQGDTGHAQADMVTRVYSHILDEDRKVNAQKFEAAFYSNPDLRGVRPPEAPAGALDIGLLIKQLQQSPELASALAELIGTKSN